jgi:translation initiation factor eIF-2B subunit delta
MTTPQPQPQPQQQQSDDAVGNASTKKKKAPPQNLVIPPPRPQLSKAERRAIQEQQRAAKAAASGGTNPTSGSKTLPSKVVLPSPSVVVSSNSISDASKTLKSLPSATGSIKSSGTNKPFVSDNENRNSTNTSAGTDIEPRAALVSHLSPYKDPNVTFDTGAVLRPKGAVPPDLYSSLHPAVIVLGYHYSTGTIRGGNARCRTMLECYNTALQDFAKMYGENNTTDSTASTTDWRSTIENTIMKPAFTYWTEYCRPHSVSMGNAFTTLKTAINSFDRDLPLDDIIQTLLETIEAYIRERIEYAKAAIAETACTKLLFRRHENSVPSKMEVILTYGHSEAVAAVLSYAIASGTKNLRIIIVDSPPLLEGRILLEKLQREAIVSNAKENMNITDPYVRVQFSYIHLHAITYVLPTVTKVLLGAAALQSDGSVTGRAGTAVVALSARAKNIPVLICTETHKISNRGIPLESLTQNELFSGSKPDTATITSTNPGIVPKRIDLLYDLTPASFVSGIVTELGIVPPSSVAVLLRELYQPSTIVK